MRSPAGADGQAGVDTDPTRRGIDTLGMFEAVAGLPEQVETAVEVAQGVDGLPDGEGVANVLLLGMGGSGVAGDVIAAMAQQFMAVPVVVAKGYDAPSFVAPDTLVIALSFSGDTEETIQAAQEAQVNGGAIVTVCSGGALAELSDDWGVPRLAIPAEIPPGTAAKLEETALDAFRALGCYGFGRVDTIVAGDDLWVLDVKTIPGFTETSTLPLAAEAAGISFERLVETILESALQAESPAKL